MGRPGRGPHEAHAKMGIQGLAGSGNRGPSCVPVGRKWMPCFITCYLSRDPGGGLRRQVNGARAEAGRPVSTFPCETSIKLLVCAGNMASLGRRLRGAGLIPATVKTRRLRRRKGVRPITEAMPFPCRARANPGGTEHSRTARAALRVHLHTALSPHSLPPRWAAQVKAIEDLACPSSELSGLPEV